MEEWNLISGFSRLVKLVYNNSFFIYRCVLFFLKEVLEIN
jgi:hypothetical protein